MWVCNSYTCNKIVTMRMYLLLSVTWFWYIIVTSRPRLTSQSCQPHKNLINERVLMIIVGYGFNFILIQVKSGRSKFLQFSVRLSFAVDWNHLHRILNDWIWVILLNVPMQWSILWPQVKGCHILHCSEIFISS